MRQFPKKYKKLIKQVVKTYKGDTYKLPGCDTEYEYVNKKAWRKAKKFMKTVQKSETEYPLLESCGALDKAANAHTSDIGESGSTSHEGSDGYYVEERVAEYAEAGEVAENLYFGSTKAL